MGLMFRRRRPIARMAAGAATAGVAYHAGKSHAEQAQRDQPATSADQQAQEAPQYAPPPPTPSEAPAAAASPAGDTDELERLAQLRTSGVLTDEEFTAAKAKLLGL